MQFFLTQHSPRPTVPHRFRASRLAGHENSTTTLKTLNLATLTHPSMQCWPMHSALSLSLLAFSVCSLHAELPLLRDDIDPSRALLHRAARQKSSSFKLPIFEHRPPSLSTIHVSASLASTGKEQCCSAAKYEALKWPRRAQKYSSLPPTTR